MRAVAVLVLSAVLAPIACGGADDEASLDPSGESMPRSGAAATDGGEGDRADGGGGGDGDGGDGGQMPPAQRAPCATAECWSAPALGGACGMSTVAEDFGSGRYDVHQYTLLLPRDTKVDLKLDVTGGSFNPAIIVNAANGATLYDGENGALGVSSKSSGRGAASAAVSLTASSDQQVSVFVMGWSVVDSGFVASMPTDAGYSLSATVDCVPPPGALLSPPNFDPTNKNAGGYNLLPASPGLYTQKPDACSRGTKRLIDVIYTVATRWKVSYPSLSPFGVRDMNEGSCSTVDHATHDDGTHVDLVAGCATNITCADKAPKIALAKLFVDTGVVCGILNNDTAVHKAVNDYFAAKTDYAPWNGKFMRSVVGHTTHFHVRVKKPDGTCN